MSVFDSISKKFGETAKLAAKKSTDLIESAKIKMNIEIEELKIDKEFIQIGKLIYGKFDESKNNLVFTDEILECCNKIQSYKEQISSLNQKLNDVKNFKSCESCGELLTKEMHFCTKCGLKQEVIVVEEVKHEKICDSCGEICKINDAFCHGCGKKFE